MSERSIEKEAFVISAPMAALFFAFNAIMAAQDIGAAGKQGFKGVKSLAKGNVKRGMGQMGKSAMHAALAGLSVAWGGGSLRAGGKALQLAGKAGKTYKAFNAAKAAGLSGLAAQNAYQAARAAQAGTRAARFGKKLVGAGRAIRKIPGVKQISKLDRKHPWMMMGGIMGGGRALDKLAPPNGVTPKMPRQPFKTPASLNFKSRGFNLPGNNRYKAPRGYDSLPKVASQIEISTLTEAAKLKLIPHSIKQIAALKES